MKCLFILRFSIWCFIVVPCQAQNDLESIPFCGFNVSNGYYNNGKMTDVSARPAEIGDRSGIPDVVAEIQKKIEIDVNIAIYILKVNTNNCFATIGKGGQKMLIVDNFFLDQVNKETGTEWAAISIIAHEVGHLIAGFKWRTNRLDRELDGDYWSGYILKKLGAGKEEAIKCIMFFGTEEDTKTHPNKYARAEVIKQGWTDAAENKIDESRCNNCVTPR